MFSIHNFRQPWELMPTALSLKAVMEDLGERDSGRLSRLTGLSLPQVERCLKLLELPERFQLLSLDPDPHRRIPSNFWIEARPVVELVERERPDLARESGGREGLLDQLVLKHRSGAIRSVIHFRRIMEAYEHSDTQDDQREETPSEGESAGSGRQRVLQRIEDYVRQPDLETRRAFDEFVAESRTVQSAVTACRDFLRQIQRLKLEYLVEADDVVRHLQQVRDSVDAVLQRLAGAEPPEEEPAEEEQE
jgi:hypothetical protein